MWVQQKYCARLGLKPLNVSLQEGFVYVISLLIDYIGVDEVGGGLT